MEGVSVASDSLTENIRAASFFPEFQEVVGQMASILLLAGVGRFTEVLAALLLSRSVDFASFRMHRP